MENILKIIRNLFVRPFWRHAVFCLLIFVFFFIGILSNARPMSDTAPRSMAACFFFYVCCYSGRLFFHCLIKQKKLLLLFSLGFLYYLGLSVLLAGGVRLFAGHELELTRLFTVSMLIVAGAMLVGFMLSAAHKLLQDQLNELKLKDQQKQSELNLLQSQLNPHFLFNTLNNLYGISITQHQRIPPLLLKLSDLLRYSVYETGQSFVPLTDEINYIKNYIEFEQLRTTDRLVLKVELDTAGLEDMMIPPLLLIVFVENAFKHAKDSVSDTINITIELAKIRGQLFFGVQNSYDGKVTEGLQGKRNSGLGLENVIKRLNLLYPGTHTLAREHEDGYYKVALTLKIK